MVFEEAQQLSNWNYESILPIKMFTIRIQLDTQSSKLLVISLNRFHVNELGGYLRTAF